MKTITIFGSSVPRAGTEIYEQGRQLGSLLADAGFAVCNGGYGGLMEASARGAKEAGGHTIGVTCSIWPARANRWIVEENRTRSFVERLTTLIERGDAYIVLPGGTGTLAELALAWEMMNKASLLRTVGGRRPLLVMAPYWQPVINCLNQESEIGSGSEAKLPALNIVTLIHRVDEAVDQLKQERESLR